MASLLDTKKVLLIKPKLLILISLVFLSINILLLVVTFNLGFNSLKIYNSFLDLLEKKHEETICFKQETDVKFSALQTEFNSVKSELDFVKKLGIEDVELLEVTAYTNRVEECDDTPNITATGMQVFKGLVAISPDMLKQGWNHKKFAMIQGLPGLYQIDDSMGYTRKDGNGGRMEQTKSMDIFFFKENHSLARQFGRSKRIVMLVNPASIKGYLEE